MREERRDDGSVGVGRGCAGSDEVGEVKKVELSDNLVVESGDVERSEVVDGGEEVVCEKEAEGKGFELNNWTGFDVTELNSCRYVGFDSANEHKELLQLQRRCERKEWRTNRCSSRCELSFLRP